MTMLASRSLHAVPLLEPHHFRLDEMYSVICSNKTLEAYQSSDAGISLHVHVCTHA